MRYFTTAFEKMHIVSVLSFFVKIRFYNIGALVLDYLYRGDHRAEIKHSLRKKGDSGESR